jgi:hypothetical protein
MRKSASFYKATSAIAGVMNDQFRDCERGEMKLEHLKSEDRPDNYAKLSSREQWAVDKSLGRLDDGFEELLAEEAEKRKQSLEITYTCPKCGKVYKDGTILITGETRTLFQKEICKQCFDKERVCHYCSERQGEDLVFANSICKPCGDKVRQYLALIEIETFTRTENESLAVKEDFERKYLHRGDVFCLKKGASIEDKKAVRKLTVDSWFVVVTAGWENNLWLVVISPLIYHEYDSNAPTFKIFQTPGTAISHAFLAKKRRINI